jgi:hypothetical protein
VFNAAVMRLPLPVLLLPALLAAPALTPAAAAARTTELGRLASPPKTSCPSGPCRAVTRTTAFQVKVGDRRGIHVAGRDGKIVAATFRLGKPGPRQRAFFNENFGGRASARLTILRPGARQRYRVTGQSEVFNLEPHFGRTAQFPLDRSLTVKKGYTVALTVPTWAPVLAVEQDRSNAWRASRPRDRCDDFRRQTAQQRRQVLAQYACLYRTERLAYSATLVSTP